MCNAKYSEYKTLDKINNIVLLYNERRKMLQKYKIWLFLTIVLLSPKSLFSQTFSSEDVMVYVIFTYAEMLHTSMTQENEADFLYLLRFSGNNIEDGIENYFSSHRLVFRDEDIEGVKKVSGYTREEGDSILEYVEIFKGDEYFRNIFYLAVAWNICDYKVTYYNMTLRMFNDRRDFERLNEYTLLKTNIETRANILSISSPARRFLQSLFDRRTYTRLGL
jgi:hypothetical protein